MLQSSTLYYNSSNLCKLVKGQNSQINEILLKSVSLFLIMYLRNERNILNLLIRLDKSCGQNSLS